MKVYYYGDPDRGFIQWAFDIKDRCPKCGYALFVPVLLIFAVCGPVAWSLVQFGTFGHWLAGKIGIHSHEVWE
jgi:hypothetical protein